MMGKKQQVKTKLAVVLRQFQEHLEQLTDVPVQSQKLVHRGRNLCSLGAEITLADCRLKDGDTLMLLGRPYDPQSDQLLARVVEIESEASGIAVALDSLHAEMKELGQGFIEGAMLADCCGRLKRRVDELSERLMHVLERLDALSVAQAAEQVRRRRKAATATLNALLDRSEQLTSAIDAIGFPKQL